MQRFDTKKSLGQHFLIDESILRRIADAGQIAEGDVVVEIGPGTGLLTKHLLRQPLGELIAYELDQRAIDVLETDVSDERFRVVHSDFLNISLAEIAATAPLNVIGNIPYYITTPIVFKLIAERHAIRSATLLMQLEVAERLIAVPSTKAYGIPSVIAQCFAEISFLFKVKPGAFRPPPNVESAVVRFDFQRDFFTRTSTTPPANFDDLRFAKMIRTLFAMRRKTIRNNLKSLMDTAPDQTLLAPYLGRRVEELDVAEAVKLYTILYPV